MRKKFFVTSLVQSHMKKGKTTVKNMNKERISLISKLATSGKRVIIIAPKNITQENQNLLKNLTMLKNVRVMRVEPNSVYNIPWTRDLFTRLKRRFYAKEHSTFFRNNINPILKRHFGEGGRIINLGKINGKPTIILSSTVREKTSIDRIFVEKEIREEIELLKRQGYNVFELPGHFFSPYRKNPELKKTWFDHLDVFINTIPEKKLILVNPDYLQQNNKKIREILKQTKYKLLVVPEEEKLLYPANFLNMGKGEILINSDAKKTIELLRKQGVKVFASPKGIRANMTKRGGIGCFVNID